jgi:GAF domain-containing protein
MGRMTTTVRFLQEENQRLQDRNRELEEENAYLHDSFKSLRALLRALSRPDAGEDVMGLLNRIIYEVRRGVDAEDSSLSLIDYETQELVFVVVHGTLQERLQGYRLPLGTGVAGWVAVNQEPVIANDIHHENRFSDVVDQTFGFRTQSLAAVPLISRGKVLGVIEVVNKFSGQPFDDRDIEVLTVLGSIAAAAIDLAGLRGQESF